MRRRSRRTARTGTGERIDGLKLGPVIEGGGLPFAIPAARAAIERDRELREADEAKQQSASGEPRASAMRDFLAESAGEHIPDEHDLAESGDLGQAVTLVAFRRRYGLGPDVVLTPRLVAELIAQRERERQARAMSGDPHLGR